MTEKKNDEWNEFLKSVNPLKKNKIKYIYHLKNKESVDPLHQQSSEQISLENIEIPDENFELQKNNDINLIRKIKKGKKKIEGTLDLHGLRVYEAKIKVFKFIKFNFEKKKRLLLIITGKGKRLGVEHGWRGQGILKELVPQWIGSILISKFVLWYINAPNDLGGHGAYIVYLKKLKE
tara:strand:+ start:1527 stop:2060 length:534 start_codon:yes stop_codon:yes gene_type:complete